MYIYNTYIYIWVRIYHICINIYTYYYCIIYIYIYIYTYYYCIIYIYTYIYDYFRKKVPPEMFDWIPNAPPIGCAVNVPMEFVHGICSLKMVQGSS